MSRKLYIACSDMDLDWDIQEVQEVEEMWNKGIPLEMIASSFGRDLDEVAILIMDRARQGRLSKRKYGALGAS